MTMITNLKEFEDLGEECRQAASRVETRAILDNNYDLTLLQSNINRRCCKQHGKAAG